MSYFSRTGAIYIDPEYLLIGSDTPDIVDTVDKDPDYSSSCDDSLNYKQLYRYMKNGEYAYNYKVSNRTINDVLYLAGQLLFHELSHANDFFPPSLLNKLSANISVHEAADSNIKSRISYQLGQIFPLLSDILRYQADVMYDCANATCQQTSYTTQEIVNEFINDKTNDT